MNKITRLYELYKAHPHVFIDTRKAVEGGIFFAIGQKDEQGKHRGNDFAWQALEEYGAACAVVNDAALVEKHGNDERFFLVKDCEIALQALAQHHRQQLRIPIVAIAGSNGKTTTKELLQAALSKKYNTFATIGNLNNHLGVPLSLLQINEEHELALLEIGANHLGETRQLARWIKPTHGIVTNCGKDHLGEYGSFENVVTANKELYDVLDELKSLAFVNAKDSLLMEMSAALRSRSYYGKKKHDAWATIVEAPELKIRLFLNQKGHVIPTKLFGSFWLDTLVGVAHVAQSFGVGAKDIVDALKAYQPHSLRSEKLKWKGNTVLLDCYNANPTSMEAFVKDVQNYNKKGTILILGEMLELGEYSKAEHQALVKMLSKKKAEQIYLVGASFKAIQLPNWDNLTYFEHKEALVETFQKQLFRHKSFFVKGSRANRLEDLFK